MTASRKIEPTKKIAMRVMTEFAAFETARSGLSDSAAAIVAISAPTIEKITVTTPAVTAEAAVGEEAAVRGEVAEVEVGVGPDPEDEERAAGKEDDDGARP